MKKLTTVAAGFLALLIAFPLHDGRVRRLQHPRRKPRPCRAPAVATPATGQWRPPLQQAYTLTSPFGQRVDPITGVTKVHTGQDLAALPGPGPVVAAAAGTVTVGWDPDGYGNYVTIDHGAGLATRYGHLASIEPNVRTGSTVCDGPADRRRRVHRTLHRRPPALRGHRQRDRDRPRPVHARARGAAERHSRRALHPTRHRPQRPRRAARRDRVPAAPAGQPTPELPHRRASADPRRHQGPVRGGRRPLPHPLDPAGRHRHGGDRTRPQQPPRARPVPKASCSSCPPPGRPTASTATATAAPTSATTPTRR